MLECKSQLSDQKKPCPVCPVGQVDCDSCPIVQSLKNIITQNNSDLNSLKAALEASLSKKCPVCPTCPGCDTSACDSQVKSLKNIIDMANSDLQQCQSVLAMKNC